MGNSLQSLVFNSLILIVQLIPQVFNFAFSNFFHCASAAVAGHPCDVMNHSQHQLDEHLGSTVYGNDHQNDSSTCVDSISDTGFRLRDNNIDVNEQISQNSVPEAPK